MWCPGNRKPSQPQAAERAPLSWQTACDRHLEHGRGLAGVPARAVASPCSTSDRRIIRGSPSLSLPRHVPRRSASLHPLSMGLAVAMAQAMLSRNVADDSRGNRSTIPGRSQYRTLTRGNMLTAASSTQSVSDSHLDVSSVECGELAFTHPTRVAKAKGSCAVHGGDKRTARNRSVQTLATATSAICEF